MIMVVVMVMREIDGSDGGGDGVLVLMMVW